MRFQTATSRILALALSAIGAVVLAACGGGESRTRRAGNPQSAATDYDRALEAAPPPLAALYANGDAIIDGGAAELRSAARGAPRLSGRGQQVGVVVRAVPVRVSGLPGGLGRAGDEVAFLGVDVYDNTDAANDFLDELPLPYPSVSDPDEQIKDDLGLRWLPGDRLL